MGNRLRSEPGFSRRGSAPVARFCRPVPGPIQIVQITLYSVRFPSARSRKSGLFANRHGLGRVSVTGCLIFGVISRSLRKSFRTLLPCVEAAGLSMTAGVLCTYDDPRSIVPAHWAEPISAQAAISEGRGGKKFGNRSCSLTGAKPQKVSRLAKSSDLVRVGDGSNNPRSHPLPPASLTITCKLSRP